MKADQIAVIEIIPIELPLIEPFIISYGASATVESVVVRITDRSGVSGWGEATPDQTVTGETQATVFGDLCSIGGPALLGADARRRDLVNEGLERLLPNAPAARCALDIALHDLAARKAGIPLWALLGGSKSTLRISRVVSSANREQMAPHAVRQSLPVRDGQAKVGERANVAKDIERLRQDGCGRSRDRHQDRCQSGMGRCTTGPAAADGCQCRNSAPDYTSSRSPERSQGWPKRGKR